MKKITTLFCFFLLSISSAFGQKEIEAEVNKTLWKPFVETWRASDAEGFNALHTDDVLRASRNGLRAGKAYKDSNTAAMAGSQERKDKRNIQFWFEQRTYSETMGYEVGYYKVTINRPGEEERNYYAQFHVVLRKENGKWKIAQDYDTSVVNGKTLDESDWSRGTPLNF